MTASDQIPDAVVLSALKLYEGAANRFEAMRGILAAQAERQTPAGIVRAFQMVNEYLETEYVVDACRRNRVVGCISCQAVSLQEQLAMFGRELSDEVQSHHFPHFPLAVPQAVKETARDVEGVA